MESGAQVAPERPTADAPIESSEGARPIVQEPTDSAGSPVVEPTACRTDMDRRIGNLERVRLEQDRDSSVGEQRSTRSRRPGCEVA
jgi:hypothetical protein